MSCENITYEFTYICNKKYKICLSKILGEGLTSIVYEGFITDTNEKVAIKIINKNNKIKNIDLYVKNEINILKLLSTYDNFIKLIDSIEDDSKYYLIFEYVSEKFDKIVHSIESNKIFIYIKQLLYALIILKNFRILHNDIKPANILVKGDQIKLCDFGMAKYLDEDIDFLSGTICGSPMYMDYDKFNGIKSCKSDFWSFKLIYYEIVYGRHPFLGVKNKLELKTKLKDIGENFISQIKFYDDANIHTQLLKRLFSNYIISPESLLDEIIKLDTPKLINLNIKEEEEKDKNENKLNNSEYFKSLVNISNNVSKNSTQIFVEINDSEINQSEMNESVISNQSKYDSDIHFNIDDINDINDIDINNDKFILI